LPGIRLIVEKIDAEVEWDGLTTDLVRTTAKPVCGPQAFVC
jgi:hypothetical protein